MKYLDTLEHYCIKSAVMNLHPQPRLQECPDCHCTFSDETCDRLGLPYEGATCPECDMPMIKWPHRDFGEVHADLCVDKGAHMADWLREGKITPAEYNAWFASLSDEEKLGFSSQPKIIHICVQLSGAELMMKDSDPAEFAKLVEAKLLASAEKAYQNDYQRRYKSDTVRMENFTSRVKKEPPANAGTTGTTGTTGTKTNSSS